MYEARYRTLAFATLLTILKFNIVAICAHYLHSWLKEQGRRLNCEPCRVDPELLKLCAAQFADLGTSPSQVPGGQLREADSITSFGLTGIGTARILLPVPWKLRNTQRRSHF
jgi:hypothetical protein